MSDPYRTPGKVVDTDDDINMPIEERIGAHAMRCYTGQLPLPLKAWISPGSYMNLLRRMCKSSHNVNVDPHVFVMTPFASVEVRPRRGLGADDISYVEAG